MKQPDIAGLVERLAEVFGDFAFDSDFGRTRLRSVFDVEERKLAALRLIEEIPLAALSVSPGAIREEGAIPKATGGDR